MQVKIVKTVKGESGGEDQTFEQLFECSNIGVTTITDAMAAARNPIGRQPGIYIEMSEVGRMKGTQQTIILPDHGEVAYVMNDSGKTIDTFRWPPKGAAR